LIFNIKRALRYVLSCILRISDQFIIHKVVIITHKNKFPLWVELLKHPLHMLIASE